MEWMLMPLKRYADFSGRSRRKEYWMYLLFLIIVGIAIGVVEALLGLSATVANTGPISALFSLATLVPSIAVSVRRLHDTDRSGWWVLLPLLPYGALLVGVFTTNAALLIIGGLAVFAAASALLVFMCIDGTRGPNRFGGDPKGADHNEVFA